MKVEFTYREVMDFIRLHALFSKKLEDRVEALVESGVIEDYLPIEAARQCYNKYIYEDLNYSKLIKNSFWEEVIREICGNDIVIIDHLDSEINGVCCDACGFVVFEDKEDSFFEICPVCAWQNDGKKGEQYSSSNHCTMVDYKSKEDFDEKVKRGEKKYVNISNSNDKY